MDNCLFDHASPPVLLVYTSLVTTLKFCSGCNDFGKNRPKTDWTAIC